MEYAVQISPVSRNTSAIVRFISRMLEPGDTKKAIELAKHGGVISNNFNEKTATNFANDLRKLGAQVEVKKINVEKNTAYEVKLVDAGKSHSHVIKVIKEITGFGLKKSKQIVDTLGIVRDDLTKEAAEKIKVKLETSGAKVVIRNNDFGKPVEDEDRDKITDISDRSPIKLIFDGNKNIVHIETHSGHKLEITEEENSLLLKDQNGNKIFLSQDGI